MTSNDPFPAGYPGMRPFDAMLELLDGAADSAPHDHADRGRPAQAVGFGVFRVDSVSEFHLESLADWLAVMAVNDDQEAVTVQSIADEELFMDRANSVAYVCDTVVVNDA